MKGLLCKVWVGLLHTILGGLLPILILHRKYYLILQSFVFFILNYIIIIDRTN